MKIQNPHDKLFKETMGNVETTKKILANYLPESDQYSVNSHLRAFDAINNGHFENEIVPVEVE